MNELSPLDVENSTIFFQALHKLLEDQKGVGSDRRRAARHAYECVQLLAFYDGRTPPVQADFQGVLCRDLSPGGFSFFAAHQPQAPYVIIALGTIPFTFFVAKVLRVRPARPDEQGSHLVGCRFIRRIASPSDLLNLEQ